MKNFGERLQVLMALNGQTVPRIARALAVAPNIVRRWMASEDCAMNARNLVALAHLLNVRASWLCTGTGEISRHSPPAYTEDAWLKLFRNLGRTDRICLTDMAHIFARRASER